MKQTVNHVKPEGLLSGRSCDQLSNEFLSDLVVCFASSSSTLVNNNSSFSMGNLNGDKKKTIGTLTKGYKKPP